MNKNAGLEEVQDYSFQVYAIWRPDPDAMFVDAFSANWNNFLLLCFPSTNIVIQSWRQSSKKQNDAHIRKWLLFCTKRQADPICPTISMTVDLMTSLYDDGLSYSSINLARCALSAILESPASAYSTFGEHPDVKRFMKGIFQSGPLLPRYCNLGCQFGTQVH